MDDTYRQKLKIGPHEFEAEGPVTVVQDQVKRFLDLIASLPKDAMTVPAPVAEVVSNSVSVQIPKPPVPEADTSLDKIMRLDGRVISLTVRPRNAADAVLLLLYGQKILRSNDAVTGGEVMEGITSTGGLAVARVDRLLEKLARDGDVIVVGEHRSKTYRLTNAGLAKARQIAADLLAIVA